MTRIDGVPAGCARQDVVEQRTVADLAVLPCGPSTPDVWALAESVDLVMEVKELRPSLDAVVVLNRLGHTGESRADSRSHWQ